MWPPGFSSTKTSRPRAAAPTTGRLCPLRRHRRQPWPRDFRGHDRAVLMAASARNSMAIDTRAPSWEERSTPERSRCPRHLPPSATSREGGRPPPGRGWQSGRLFGIDLTRRLPAPGDASPFGSASLAEFDRSLLGRARSRDPAPPSVVGATEPMTTVVIAPSTSGRSVRPGTGLAAALLTAARSRAVNGVTSARPYPERWQVALKER